MRGRFGYDLHEPRKIRDGIQIVRIHRSNNLLVDDLLKIAAILKLGFSDGFPNGGLKPRQNLLKRGLISRFGPIDQVE